MQNKAPPVRYGGQYYDPQFFSNAKTLYPHLFNQPGIGGSSYEPASTRQALDVLSNVPGLNGNSQQGFNQTFRNQFLGQSRFMNKGGMVKPKAEPAQTAKSLPFGVLKLLMQDAPMGIATLGAGVVGAPKAASWLMNKMYDTPVLDYDVSQSSGYDAVEEATSALIERLRAGLDVPEPEPFSPEYMAELTGSLMIPAAPVAQLMSKLGRSGKVLGPVTDFMVAPHTIAGKGSVAALTMAPDVYGMVE